MDAPTTHDEALHGVQSRIADDDTGLTIHQRLAQATPCRPRRSLGTGQSKPPPMRTGALDALALPSRRNDTLYYRDGREEPI